jgi:hypothetical protein
VQREVRKTAEGGATHSSLEIIFGSRKTDLYAQEEQAF